MQISNLIGQYNKNQTAPVVPSNVTPSGVTSLLSTIQELTVGSIFEGNVTMVRGSHVLLNLENGQSIHAKLDNSIKLNQGQSMFFQVKSNDGNTVAIRPYLGGNIANPTLRKALTAAGLPINERNLDMVDTMMKEHMSIDAESLAKMYRNVSGMDDFSVSTLVQMEKFEIPITRQMASQFENYCNDKHAIMTQMNDFMADIPNFLEQGAETLEQAVAFNQQILAILEDGLPEEPIIMPDSPANLLMEDEMVNTIDATSIDDPLPPLDGADEVVIQASKKEYQPNQLGALFQERELADLENRMRSFGSLSENEAIFDSDGNINKNLTAKQLLDAIDMELTTHMKLFEKEDVTDLFKDTNYHKLLNQVMEEQWLIEPEQLKTEHKVKALYEKLEGQMEKLEQFLENSGNGNSKLAQTTGEIRSNMDFMNQLNQAYTYVQIPLKLSGQNANSDLYVYTNKKNLREPGGELTAFLHLDMEHLGSTDVSIRMKNGSVSADFFLKDEKSFALIQETLPILEAKLNRLGYRIATSVTNQEEKIDFVEDFLKKDLPTAGKVVHRYSFDVRA